MIFQSISQINREGVTVQGKGITFLQAQLIQHNFPTFGMSDDKLFPPLIMLFLLQNSHFFSTTYFLLPTSYFLLPTSNFQLSTSCFLPPTSYFLLPTSYFLLPTSFFLLPTSYFLLPTSLFTPSSFFFITFLLCHNFPTSIACVLGHFSSQLAQF